MMWLTLHFVCPVINSTVKHSMYILSHVEIDQRILFLRILTPSFAALIVSQSPALQDLLKLLFDETIQWMEDIRDQDDGSSSMIATLQHNMQMLTEKYVVTGEHANG